MQFSDTTNKNGLVQDIDFNCDTDNTSYPIEDKTRNINQYYYLVGIWGWKYSPLVSFDDKNFTTQPIATLTLVDNQADYDLPTSVIHIERVSVKDANGLWSDLDRLDYADIPVAPDEYMKTAGIPRQYAIKGNSIWLFPKPSSNDVTTINGLKLVLGRLVDPFVATDTTKEPGFNPAYHRLLSLGASLNYLIINNPERYERLKLEFEQLKQDFISWIINRQREKRNPRLRPRNESYE